MSDMKGRDVDDLQVGIRLTLSKTITKADNALFASVSGDNNAVHINEEVATTTPFGGRIARRILTAGVISTAGASRPTAPSEAVDLLAAKLLEPISSWRTLGSRSRRPP